MNIKPLADRVLVVPAPAEEKTIGGIIIPDTAKEKPLKGEVVAVGNGTKDEEMIVKVGDTVLTVSMQVPSSNLKETNTSSCARAISWQFWDNNRLDTLEALDSRPSRKNQ